MSSINITMITAEERIRRQELNSQGYWEIPEHIDDSGFDYSWRPRRFEPPQIYQFGTQWQRTGGPRFVVPESIGTVFIDSQRVTSLPRPEMYTVLINETIEFDYSWHPDDFEPPYIYVFGNKWNDAHTEPTLEYQVPGATDRKYVSDMIATLSQTTESWTVPNKEDLNTFDFSWRPSPYEPPQTYVWWENNGPTYTMENSIGTVYMNRDESNKLPIPQYYVETTLEDLINEHPTEVFWALNRELKYDNFDFTWSPTRENSQHINAFGNDFSKDTGTYYVNAVTWHKGYREINYVEEITIKIETDIDMFYVVHGTGVHDYDGLCERFPRLQKTRYMNSWIDTIKRCIKKSTTKFIWILSSQLDYSEFEFDYYPSRWNHDYVNVFGTQWSRWGNTYLINTETFENNTQYIKEIEHLPNVNHVRTRRAKISQCLHDIVYVDFGNQTSSLETIKTSCQDRNITVLQYDTSYYNTLKNWAQSLSEYEILREHVVWVCTSVTDYSNFDFTWAIDPFQREQLHVFSLRYDGAEQKFGDTFLLNLNVFRDDCLEYSHLSEYKKQVNYVSVGGTAKRLPHPVIHHDNDSQTDAIQKITDTDFPYMELVTSDMTTGQTVIPNLWDTERSTVVVASQDAGRIFVPVAAIGKIHKEVYDYPNIEIVKRPDRVRPLDIVFFSNGEPNADENFEYLQSLGLSNRIVHQRGVQGRVESQHAAANLSSTGWYFLVNAKLRVNPDFDFEWQPDRLQRAKHYIFMATNPVNGLEYGHQAIVANNRRLTLATRADGLDFTMSSAHEVVDMNCGTAYYNTDPWTTWRTAFREAIKLQYYGESESGSENRGRLDTWLRIGNGKNGGWSTGGAYDAVEYYKSVNGNLEKLMNTYEWRWLREYYDERYGTK